MIDPGSGRTLTLDPERPMSDIVLSHGIRTNLLSLQEQSANLDITQNRLATGKKVNSALDNPTNYFVAQSLNQKASDLGYLQDGIALGINVVQAATNGIQSITTLIQSAQGLARQALSTSDLTVRNNLAAQFNSLLDQITQIAQDSTYNGTNLLYGDPSGTPAGSPPQSLKVLFNETSTSSVTVQGVNFASGAPTGSYGLGLATAPGAAPNLWASDTDINTALTQLQGATSTLRAQAAALGANNTVLQNRQNFIKQAILTLNSGADTLTVADQNEEGAKLLALQTRQQLSTQALSLAAQSDQAVLKLFQ